MKFLKLEKRKGISPLIATLLLIAIAVAASVLTYSWVMSMIGSQSAQAQTQVRIDSVQWNSTTAYTPDVRNTGSVDAQLESVAIRENKAGSITYPIAVTKAITTGTHLKVGVTLTGFTLKINTSYVVRVTTNTGFYYESVFTTGSTIP
jgi:flagellin-like protein